MTMKSLATTAAAFGLALAPVGAQATIGDRTTPVAGENEIGGENGILIALGAAVVVIIGIIVIADGDDDDDPISF